jgi:LEA14-like dessication related protein
MSRMLVVSLCACAAACATSKPAAEPEGGPAGVSAEVKKIEEREQTVSQLNAALSITLKNEAATPARATRARFEVVSGGKVVNSGEQALAQEVPAGGEAVVEVVAPFVYAKDDEEVQALTRRKEPIEYVVRGTIDVGGGQVEFGKAAAIRAPRMPTLALTTLDVTTSPTNGITVSATVDLENPNTFPLLLQGSRWRLTIAGKQAGEGVMEHKAPKAASHTSYPIELNLDLNEVKSRKELQGATVPYALEAELDLGAAKVRLEESGETKLLRAGD